MKKRLLSIMLCLTMVMTMLTGITIQVSATDDGLTLVDQKFYDDRTGSKVALTAVPEGWTISAGTGEQYAFDVKGITLSSDEKPFKVSKNEAFNTHGNDYTFTVNFRHFSKTQYIHFGAQSLEDAVKAGISNTGYTFVAYPESGNVMKNAIYKLYKNGSEIGTWTDVEPDEYMTNKHRDYVFTVTNEGITVSGGVSGAMYEDDAPITNGYIGAYIDFNAVHGPSQFPILSSFKLEMPLVVNETDTVNGIPSRVARDGSTPVTVKFNTTLKNEGITDMTNAYLTTASGEKLTSGYTVALGSDEKSIVFTPEADALSYKATYKAVVTENIVSSSSDVKLGVKKEFPFTMENPPFETTVGLYDGTTEKVSMTTSDEGVNVSSFANSTLTLKASVLNSIGYSAGDGFVIVSFEDNDGIAVKTYAKKVTVPSVDGELCSENVFIPADAVKMNAYLVTGNLDSYHPEASAGAVIDNINVSDADDIITISGVAGTDALKDVYVMMMNIDGSTSLPYTFDPATATTEFGGNIHKFAKTTTGANGTYTISIPMNVPTASAADWRFYIGGDGFSTAQTKTYYFINKAMKNSVATEANNATDASDVLAILENEDKLEVIGIDDNEFVAAFKAADAAAADPTAKVVMTDLATKLYEAGPYNTTDGGASFVEKLNEISVYVAIKNDLRDLIVDPVTGQFTTEADAVLDFDSKDTAADITVTTVFEEELTVAARTAVLDAVMGTDYPTADGVYEVFKNNVMVEALKSDGMDITKLLRDNADHFGINLDMYNKLSTDQMAQTNDALKTATTLNATNTAAVASSIQAIIETIIADFDLSVYSYTFSAADGTFSEWTFTGSHTFENGNFKSAGNGPVYAVSPLATSGDYVLTASLSRSYNSAIYVFNYNSGSDLYFVEFNNGTSADNYTKKPVRLKKATASNFDQDGSFNTIASNNDYTGSYSNMKIVVEEEGYVTVYNSAMTDAIIPRTYVGEPLTGGKFGAGFMNVSGAQLYSVTKNSYISVDNVKETGVDGMTDVDIDTAAVFTGTFDYPVDTTTVIAENFKVLDSSKNEIENAIDNVSIEADKKTFTVTLNDGVLAYEKDYYLVITTGVTTKDGSTLIKEAEYVFTTEDSPFKAFAYLYSGSELKVTSRAGAAAQDITSYAGTTMTLKADVVNNRSYRDGDAYLIVSFENNDGKALGTFAKKVTVPVRSPFDLFTDETVSIPVGATKMYTYLVTASLDNCFPNPGAGEAIEDASVSYEGDTVTITGNAGTVAGKDVYLMMMNLDSSSVAYTFDTSVTTEFGATIQKFAKTTTGENGVFTFTIPINNAGTVATNWNFYIGGDAVAANSQPQSFYFASENMKNGIITEINGVADAMAIFNLLDSQNDKLKTLGIAENPFVVGFKTADAAAADPSAKALINELAVELFNGIPYNTTDGGASFVEKLNEISVYVAIKNDLRDLIVDPVTGQFTTEADAVLDFDSKDTAADITVTTVFEEELTVAARTAVLDAVMGTDYPTADGVYEVFKNNVMVEALKSDGMDITKLLSDNAGHFGINLIRYNQLNLDQKVETNTALKLATTLDATSTSTVATSINNIINALIQGFDLTVYNYTFSTAADAEENGWIVTNNGSFSESSGYTSVGYDGNSKLTSPASITFDGDYLFTSDAKRTGSSNKVRYYFDYEDSDNYCYVEFGVTDGILLVRKLDGESTTLATAPDYKKVGTSYGNYEANAQIIVEEAGYITVTNSTGDIVYIPRTNAGSQLTGGRVAVEFDYVPAVVKNVTVKRYLMAKNVFESGQADLVDTELAPVITGTFNYPVDTATVNTDTVRILDADGNVINGAIDNVAVADGTDLTVTVKAGALDYKTDYYLNLTTGVKLALRDCSFVSEVKLPFNTKAPELNIEAMYDTAEGGSHVFTNDISRYKEVYTNVSPNGLVIANGQSPLIFMKGENTGASPKIVDIYVTIEDELKDDDGNVTGIKTYNVVKVPNITLAEGGSGWITTSGFIASQSSLTDIAVPASPDITETAKVKYYVFDHYATAENERYTSAYPKADNLSVTDNGNRPTFSFEGEDLSVWGNTYSGTAGKVVNLVIADSGNTPKIVATTKTGANGLYKFDIKLNDKVLVSGSYHIYVGGEEFEKRVTPMDGASEKTLEYMVPTARDGVVAYVNNRPNTPTGHSEIESTINTYAEEFGFDSANENGVNIYQELLSDDPNNIKAVAAKVAAKVVDADFNETDGADEFISFVREAMVVQAYTAGITTALYGADGSFLLDDIVALSTVNSMTNTSTPATTVNAFTVYTDTLNATGRGQVRTGIINNEYTDTTSPVGTGIDELKKKFVEQVVLASLDTNNVENEGAGHITDIIKNNAVAAGIVSTVYNGYVALGENANAINNVLLTTANIDTITKLQTTLATLISGSAGGNNEPQTPPTGGLDSGSGSGSGSGGGSSVGVAGGATVGQAEANMNYTDLAGFEWAHEAISSLAKAGVVSGDGNGTFRPGDRVKREELMKMALKGMGVGVNNYVSSSFADADKSHWAYKFVATAEEKGFTTGRPDGTFGFGEDITREEVATILYRIMVALGKAGYANTSVLNGFDDKGDVSAYAVDAISFMVDNGIINGVEADVLAPKNYCTRAQVAKMVYGVMNYLNK